MPRFKKFEEVTAERREKALAKLARGEKLGFREVNLVREELAAKARLERALAAKCATPNQGTRPHAEAR